MKKKEMSDEELKERDELLDEVMNFVRKRSGSHEASIILEFHMKKVKEIRKNVKKIFESNYKSRVPMEEKVLKAIK